VFVVLFESKSDGNSEETLVHNLTKLFLLFLLAGGQQAQAQPKKGTTSNIPSMGSPQLSKQSALVACTDFWQRR